MDIESTTRPTWAQLDSINKKLTLDTTPNVTAPSNFKFGLRASWGTKNIDKKFYITVVPCDVSHCIR